jgi:hypothetical protein
MRGIRTPLRLGIRRAKHLHDIERAGESEWTPWIALLGLILFLVAAASLMLGIAEAFANLIA